MRTARARGESGIYHVVSRGVGQQIIFETDADRSRYMDALQDLVADSPARLPAWCLMDNHVHLLVEAELAELSSIIRRLNSGYALYFNLVHGRSGHLFQGRFSSEPVDSDEYLATVVRYIHQNPMKAGVSQGCSYEWSSYDRYAGGDVPPGGEIVMGLFGSVDAFVSFHSAIGSERCLDVAQRKPRVDDEHALSIALDLLGDGGMGALKTLPRDQRDAALRDLKDQGLTVRQIQRLTGISLGTISKA